MEKSAQDQVPAPDGPTIPGPRLDELVRSIRACRHCVDNTERSPLPHEPRPVLQVGPAARICIAGQAPGTRVHASGRPFTDPSGVRLRQWMDVDEGVFYDAEKIAIVPMGFCFPGLNAKGADLPPRRECAPLWRAQLFARLPQLQLILAVGTYAQGWHMPHTKGLGLSERVTRWHAQITSDQADSQQSGNEQLVIPLPHPSWRNNAWLKRNPWFETDVVPDLRRRIDALL